MGGYCFAVMPRQLSPNDKLIDVLFGRMPPTGELEGGHETVMKIGRHPAYAVAQSIIATLGVSPKALALNKGMPPF